MKDYLLDLALQTFKTPQEFLDYYEIRVVSDNFPIRIDVLYQIYCEQSENCVDFDAFRDTLVGINSKRTVVCIYTNTPSLFRERQLQYAYNNTKQSKFKKLPKFK